MANTSTAARNGARSTTRHAETSASASSSARSHFRTTTVGEIAQLLGAQFLGDESTPITGASGLDVATPGTITFIESEKLLSDALSSNAAAFIVPESLRDLVDEALATQQPTRRGGKPVVLTGNPRLAFAKVLEFLQPAAFPEKGIHPTAVIDEGAHIGEGVTIREFCYVGRHAHIGDGAVLYPHAYVGDGAQIGDDCVLYPSVVIGHHVHLGKRVKVHASTVIGGDGFGYVFDGEKHQKIPQVGNVIVEDDVEIGCNVCIDRATMGATRIGEGTKIDNLVQIAHNVQIGKNCILCGQVGLSGSVVVEDNVIMAGQVGVRDHSKINKGAIVGAQAGVIGDVGAGEFVLGAPAVPQREFMRIEAASRKMPDMIRQMRRMEKQLAELQARLDNNG